MVWPRPPVSALPWPHQLAVLALAGSIDPITNAPWFFAPTPDLELSFYPDPRVGTWLCPTLPRPIRC